MKIVFLLSALNHGGAERVAKTLCEAWASRGDSVTLIMTYSGIGERVYEVSPAVEVVSLAEVVGVRKKDIRSGARRLYALRGLVLERSPDVIVSFLTNVNVAAVIACALLRIPLIICERTDPTSMPQSRAWAIFSRLLYPFADMLTVQTDAVAVKIGEMYPGVSRIRVIPNPLPEALTAVRPQRGGQRKILIAMSRLSEEKQLDRLLRAFNELAPQYPDWDLHIYGDGPLARQLEHQIQEDGQTGRAFLRGPTKTPWTAMACADAFVMVSSYEGFPNSLLEAMGLGLPCVVFDCPSGPREITCNGKDALLVSFNDDAKLVSALVEVMGNERLRNSLGQQARESVWNRFSLAQVIKMWDRLFKEVGAIR
jgi:GalNAc-alpha-(1->4)-GalNAc-alpha-(1->3)-diNAcBac-PP-undecaprenol alpha-1,4-N-acetyl-D-galactosaminyltransferase